MRYRDSLVKLCCLGDEVLVRCPACDGRASVFPVSSGCFRLSCLGCGHTAERASTRLCHRQKQHSGPDDPYFGLPLWLRAECCGGHTLWAFNIRHLDLLESYLGARLRERGSVPGSMSLVERLPAWLKSAKHRDEALRVVRRLRVA